MFAFRAVVVVLLRDIFESVRSKILGTLIVLLRDKFHETCSNEHQGDVQKDDPLVRFRRAEKGFDHAHWSAERIYVAPPSTWVKGEASSASSPTLLTAFLCAGRNTAFAVSQSRGTTPRIK